MTTISRLVLPAAVLIFAAAGCSRFEDGISGASTPEPSYDVDGFVRTDENTYTFVERSARSKDLTVEYTIRNPGFPPLYLARCGSDPAPVLIKHQDGEWITALAPVCPLVWAPPIRIGPGGEYRGVARLVHNDGENSGHRFPSSIDSIAGTYKLSFGVYKRYDQDGDHRRADPRFGVSNEFRIER